MVRRRTTRTKKQSEEHQSNAADYNSITKTKTRKRNKEYHTGDDRVKEKGT